MNIGVDIDDTISNSFEIIFGDSQIFDIEEMNGVFKIYCDSSTFGSVAIYDNKGNSCLFTINS